MKKLLATLLCLSLLGSAVAQRNPSAARQGNFPAARQGDFSAGAQRNFDAVAKPDFDLKKLIPLDLLAGSSYQGVPGGLYPGGNTMPESHLQAGMRMAAQIRPLDAKGRPDDSHGKIVWLSIGMSNTTMESQPFVRLAAQIPGRNLAVEFVDGAFGGQEITRINNPGAPYWTNIVEQRLRPAGLTPEQVQVVWFKLAEARPTDTAFASYPRDLAAKYLSALRIVRRKFPNVRIAYLSSRIYGGNANTTLNPEPFAWYTGWANRFAIEAQLRGDPGTAFEGAAAVMPWLAWGPYLWSNAAAPNGAGISWGDQADFAADGTHPSRTGAMKVAQALVKFFTTDPTSVVWLFGE